MICGKQINPYRNRKRQKTCSKECRKQLKKQYGKKCYYENRKNVLERQKQYYRQNKKKVEVYHKIYLKKLKKKLLNLKGSKCIICDAEKNLIFHEIHGKKHVRSLHYISNHINDFILLCYFCHMTLHRLIKYPKIVSLIKEVKK